MHPKDANIIVTGGTGFLGSRIIERLAKEKESGRIIASGRTIKTHSRVDSPWVEYRLGDITDALYVQDLFPGEKVHYVINCAALSSPWGPYESFFRANVCSQKFLLKASEQAAIKRYIHISSPSIYANLQDRLGIKESDPLPAKMINHYAATKLQAEKILEKSNLKWICLRPRALIGRGDTVVVPRVIRAFDEGRLRIIGDGKNISDITPVSNVVDAVVLALQAPIEACNRHYNISNGNPALLWDVLKKSLQKLGRELPDKKVPRGLALKVAGIMELYSKWFQNYKEPALTRYGIGTVANSFTLDISLARHYLGYEARQSVEEAIEEFVFWYKSLDE